MGRPLRAAEAGYVYHVLNRANARMTIFEKDEDDEAFERVLAEAVERTKTRLLAYCLMPNHWHLMVSADNGADNGATHLDGEDRFDHHHATSLLPGT